MVSSSGGSVAIDWESSKGKGVALQPAKGAGGWARQFGFASASLSDHWGGFGGYGPHSGSLTKWFIGGAHDTNAMTIVSSSGNVGIGTTSPGELLALNASGAAELSVTSTTSDVNIILNSGTDGSVETSYIKFNDANFLTFNTRRNKKIDLTEYYDLIYEYKNDCLIAGIKYKKSYYEDRDLKPSENIMFTISFYPLTSIEQSFKK